MVYKLKIYFSITLTDFIGNCKYGLSSLKYKSADMSTNKQFYITYNTIPVNTILMYIKNKLVKHANKAKINLNFTYNLNEVTNKNGEKLGFGYLWFDDIRVANALNGKNFDGSDRIQVRKLEDLSEKELSARDAEMYEKMMAIETEGKSWAQIQMECDDLEDSYKEQTSVETLDPLITFDQLIEKTNEQVLSIRPIYFNPLDEKFDGKTIKAAGIPKFVNKKMLAELFERYSSIKGMPNININANGAFVTFHLEIDCRCALNQHMKWIIKNPNTGKDTLIYFSHTFAGKKIS
ncbi:hypothetical protein D3C87_940200 [compost metagenome]